MTTVFCVNGKFSAFDYCKYLNKKNLSLTLITTYPYFYLKKYGLNSSQVISFVWLELVKRINQRIFLDRGFFLIGNLIDNFTHEIFDHLCSEKLKKLKFNKLIVFSGSSEKSLSVAKIVQAKSFLIRGSAHILSVKKILDLESKKCNATIQLPHKYLIKRELNEYKFADKIIVHSKFAFKSFIKEGMSKSKVSIIPLGVDRVLKNNFFKKKKSNKQILYLGQVSIRKGVHYLLKIFSSLNLKDVTLVIAGPVQKEMGHILKKYEINKNIKILGRVGHSEKINLFKKSNIFCLPTLEDGFAKVLLEAAEYGNYLLSSKFSAGPDIINENKNLGVVFDPRNDVEFKKKLLFSINYVMQNKINKCTNIINNRYNWDVVTDQFCAILNSK
jgi:glycosyltransferase involved in cell wall biosynthesis